MGIDAMGFLLALLAVWRLTHLLAEEDGPFDLVLRLRMRLGHGLLGGLLDCFHCLSLWVAMPFAYFLGAAWGARVLAWLALSGGACLLYRITAPRSAPEREEPR